MDGIVPIVGSSTSLARARTLLHRGNPTSSLLLAFENNREATVDLLLAKDASLAVFFNRDAHLYGLVDIAISPARQRMLHRVLEVDPAAATRRRTDNMSPLRLPSWPILLCSTCVCQRCYLVALVKSVVRAGHDEKSLIPPPAWSVNCCNLYRR